MISLDVWSFLIVFGVFQGYFLSLVLLLQRQRKPFSNRLLAALLLVISVNLSELLIVNLGWHKYVPHVLAIHFPFVFVVGPLYYFYTLTLLNSDFRFRLWHLVHLTPFVAAVLYRMPFFAQSGESKIAFVDHILSLEYLPISATGFLIMSFQVAQSAAYISLAIRELRNHEKKLQGSTSRKWLTKIRWLRKFSGIYIAYSCVSLVGLILLAAMNAYTVEIDNSVAVCGSLLVHAVGYITLRQPEIYAGPDIKSSADKYQRSTLSQDQSRSYLTKLVREMETQKPYLRNDLKLSELAKAVAISRNHISQILSQELNTNFYDFVNKYRIEEAKSRLTDPKNGHLTILAVALDVGFSNKTSFNRTFKKHTGITPSEFVRRSHQVHEPKAKH